MPEHLVTFLADRDEPCPLCGYNLRNLQNDRCPECGRQLQLTVGLTEPAIGVWVSLLVATLLPAAFGLFLIAVSVAYLMFASRGFGISLKGIGLPALYIFGQVLLAVPAAGAVLLWRRRFLKWPALTQRVCMIAAWATDLLSVICVIYLTGH